MQAAGREPQKSRTDVQLLFVCRMFTTCYKLGGLLSTQVKALKVLTNYLAVAHASAEAACLTAVMHNVVTLSAAKVCKCFDIDKHAVLAEI